MEQSQVYIKIDTANRVIACDGGYTKSNILSIEDWILIDAGTGDRYNLCQTHYFPGGLTTADGIPLYRWDGTQVVPRTEEEIEVDRAAPLRVAKLAELSAAGNAAIVAGCDVTLSDGTMGHISLTQDDQINLSTAQAAVKAGAAGYPYHLDGKLCVFYQAADILTMATAAVSHILYHTTYCNHLLNWARRVTTAEELAAITYGAALPDDLASNMAVVLADAGGGAGA